MPRDLDRSNERRFDGDVLGKSRHRDGTDTKCSRGSARDSQAPCEGDAAERESRADRGTSDPVFLESVVELVRKGHFHETRLK